MLSKIKLIAASLLFTILLVTGCALTPSSPTPTSGVGSLQMTVADESGNPLQGAKVVSEEQPAGQLKVSGLSDAAGKVAFSNVRAGEYTFLVSRFDYEPKRVAAVIMDSRTSIITVNLAATATQGSP